MPTWPFGHLLFHLPDRLHTIPAKKKSPTVALMATSDCLTHLSKLTPGNINPRAGFKSIFVSAPHLSVSCVQPQNPASYTEETKLINLVNNNNVPLKRNTTATSWTKGFGFAKLCRFDKKVTNGTWRHSVYGLINSKSCLMAALRGHTTFLCSLEGLLDRSNYLVQMGKSFLLISSCYGFLLFIHLLLSW